MIQVASPGLFTTVQDLGRWGHQHHGVPVAGPMDSFAHRLANLAVGNDPECATLEITLAGPKLRFDRPVRFAMTGAQCALTLDGRHVEPNVPFEAAAGSELSIGWATRGARAYLAISGGIDVPRVLGSRSTHAPSRMGGLDGRALKAGDRLSVAQVPRHESRSIVPLALPDGGARVRILPGPEAAAFADDALRVLTRSNLLLHQDSNRMGFRLIGPALEPSVPGGLSVATTMGTIQVPPDGQPILLMADCQTTGGYPRLAHVISADLGLAGQLKPGDWIGFELCLPDEARAALRDRESELTAAGGLKSRSPGDWSSLGEGGRGFGPASGERELQ
jgi:antagonist of KipI